MKRLRQFELVYLATPYTKFPQGHEWAFIQACKVAGAMMGDGINVFCPIAHTHPIAKWGMIPAIDHEFWMARNKPLAERCGALAVARMEGWDKSEGIADEKGWFRSWGRPVFHLDHEKMEIVE